MTTSAATPGSISYSRTQIGWWLLVALGAGTLLSLGVLAGYDVGHQSLPPQDMRIIAGVVVVVLLISAALLSTLNVRITGDTLAWRFGPGLVRFSLPLAEIVSAVPSRTSWLAGIGIHYVGSGWVYNVSGRDAVEVTKRDGSKVWIGTAEPDVLATAIERHRAGLRTVSSASPTARPR